MVSTIVQPVPDMARKAVELLLKKIKGEEIETLTILPVEFAEGGTIRYGMCLLLLTESSKSPAEVANICLIYDNYLDRL